MQASLPPSRAAPRPRRASSSARRKMLPHYHVQLAEISATPRSEAPIVRAVGIVEIDDRPDSRFRPAFEGQPMGVSGSVATGHAVFSSSSYRFQARNIPHGSFAAEVPYRDIGSPEWRIRETPLIRFFMGIIIINKNLNNIAYIHYEYKIISIGCWKCLGMVLFPLFAKPSVRELPEAASGNSRSAASGACSHWTSRSLRRRRMMRSPNSRTP